MSGWRSDLNSLAGQLARTARHSAGALRRMVDRGDEYHVVPYRGYGNAATAVVLGRVLRREMLEPADATNPRWRNLLNTLQRIDADPLAYAQVAITIGDASQTGAADDEGFLHHRFAPTPLNAVGWRPATLSLADPAFGDMPATAPILFPPATARFGVVSDMDDTVLQSEVGSFLRAARLLLLENSRTRLPFPGVAEFYKALHGDAADGLGNPIFYVSSSPWNLYDVIADFLEAQGIPTGPLLLRDWELRRSALRHREHKGDAIREILATYPTLPFILIGDSGQEDPEIYAEIVHAHPRRIVAVYIRDVTRTSARSAAIRTLAEEVRAAGSSLVLAEDTVAAARHAAEHGWIDPAAVARIEARAD